jgi:hypothetical protein
MKVNIGPYKGWTGPYQIADKIFFWLDQHGIYDDDDPRLKRWDYKAHDKLGNWLASTWVSDFCNWFDNKKKRKVKIHIDPYDTWSMDHTLALIIHPLLVQLKEKNHGYFSVDEEDTPIEAGVKDEYGSDSKAEERYNWVMDELNLLIPNVTLISSIQKKMVGTWKQVTNIMIVLEMDYVFLANTIEDSGTDEYYGRN